MFEIKIKLICPKCDKKYSEGKIYREKALNALAEAKHWESIKTILKCQKCDCFLVYSAEYFFCPESETKVLDEIKTLFKNGREKKVLTGKLF